MKAITANNGFTLLEILVALTIFAVMSSLAYGGMRHVLDTNSELEKRTETLAALQNAFVIINNDLSQFINRSVRDRLGGELPAFDARKGTDIKLALTTQIRSSWQWQNSISNLVRVQYRYEEGSLYRDSWPVLDRAHDSKPESVLLLKEPGDIEFEFINQLAYEFWPLPKGHKDYAEVPKAVRISYKKENGAEIKRLFLLQVL